MGGPVRDTQEYVIMPVDCTQVRPGVPESDTQDDVTMPVDQTQVSLVVQYMIDKKTLLFQ